ncbi:MAG: hypothetical protein ACM3VV_07010 [Deltaproteobacteria bacterium]
MQTDFMNGIKQTSQELTALIKELRVKLLIVRDLYIKIEQKAIQEENFTEEKIAKIVDQKYKMD